jgi:tetratricopeptide (TPR) repeat protein
LLERARLPAFLLALALASPGFSGGLADAIASGNAALDAGQVEEAKTRYAAGFVDAPEAPELHYSMGLAHLRAGERDKASEFFRGAAERAEAAGRRGLAARALYNLGIALAEGPGGAPAPAPAPEAAAEPEAPAAVLGSGPRPPEPPPGIAGGMPLGAGGPDWKGALGAFEKSIRMDPTDLDAKYNYLRVKKRLEQLQQPSQQKKPGESEENEDSDEDEQDDGGEGQEGAGEGEQGQDEQDPNQDQDQGQSQGGQNQDQSSGSEATDDGNQGDSPEGPQAEKDMDRQAMERFLDAVEAESKDQLKRFLRGRRARPRDLTHDW